MYVSIRYIKLTKQLTVKLSYDLKVTRLFASQGGMMFVFDSLFWEMAYLGVAITGVLFAWTMIVGRWKMKSNAKKMAREKSAGLGSLVSHGMVYDNVRGVGVKRDSKPSDNWFQKLI